MKYNNSALCSFPNIVKIKLCSENIFETKIKLDKLNSLKKLILYCQASNDYDGEVDSENTDEEYQFGIELHE